MGWFTSKPNNSDTAGTSTAPVRVHSTHLSSEPSFVDLAFSCINAAGPEHPADPVSVLTGIYNITAAQVAQWFTALRRPQDGQSFHDLFHRDDFTDQHLWDFLTGDPGKIAAHNQLAELLASEQLHDVITSSIRQGSHAPTT